jgi:hypothetical protein
MLATIDTPNKIRLPTTVTIAGFHHEQIVHVQVSPHIRSILGRAYACLFQTPLTQTMNPTIPIPKVHQTKGLTSRRSEKMSWAILLLQDSETLQAYEEYARESAYEAEGDQPPLPTPLLAGTNTKTPALLAKGGLHQ